MSVLRFPVVHPPLKLPSLFTATVSGEKRELSGFLIRLGLGLCSLIRLELLYLSELPLARPFPDHVNEGSHTDCYAAHHADRHPEHRVFPDVIGGDVIKIIFVRVLAHVVDVFELPGNRVVDPRCTLCKSIIVDARIRSQPN